MKQSYLALGGALVLTLAACVPQPRTVPPVQTRPTPAPAPAPPPPAPVYDNWMDAPATSGDWSYRPESAGGTALFGEPATEGRFSMRCIRANRTIILSRAGQATGTATMTIRTESQTRTLAATPAAGQLSAIESRLAASDRLLDAMALTKGRFAVEVSGTPTLYLPSWAEVTRVIEDCR